MNTNTSIFELSINVSICFKPIIRISSPVDATDLRDCIHKYAFRLSEEQFDNVMTSMSFLAMLLNAIVSI